MSRSILVVGLLGAVACGGRTTGEDPSDWYTGPGAYDVTEHVEFTADNYDFPSSAADGIGAFADAVFPVDNFVVAYGPDDQYAEAANCDAVVNADLPWEIEGIVTAHPRYYVKTVGCDGDDEKYYGSYFIQDRTGAAFVLGDSKVAHFDMGDRVRIRVRGAKTSFDMNTVFSHDVLEIERGPFPIYYEIQREPFTLDDVARTKRVTGVVATEPDTFGEFSLAVCQDDSVAERIEGAWSCDDGSIPNLFAITLDVELNRRGLYYPPGSRLQVTGPVIYSFSTFAVVVMRKGQISVLTP